MAFQLEVPPRMLRAAEGRTVHVDPYETSAVWAHDLAWAPVPVFQSYSAYTRRLDEANADRLRTDAAPELILRQPGLMRVGGRSPESESPEYNLALVCNYRELMATESWQLLERAPDRCGRQRLIRSVRAEADALIAVPRPPATDDAVFVRLRLPRDLGASLRSAAYKTAALPLAFVDGGSFTFPRALAEGPILVQFPRSLGWSPYRDRISSGSVRLLNVPAPLRADFYAVRVAPPGPGAGDVHAPTRVPGHS